MREHARRSYHHAFQPCPCPFLAPQSFVFLPRPPHQMAVDALTEGTHRGRIEPGEVREPPANDLIDVFREVVESEVDPSMQPPRPYPAAHLRQFVRADSR